MGDRLKVAAFPVGLKLLLYFLTRFRVCSTQEGGCVQTCGNLTVPYPFSFSPDCGVEELQLNCEQGQAYIPSLSAEFPVMEINMSSLIVQTTSLRAYGCQSPTNVSFLLRESTAYVLSGGNQFFARGCNITGSFMLPTNNLSCKTHCQPKDQMGSNLFCEGMSCCTSDVPVGTRTVTLASEAPRQNDCNSSYSSMILPQSWNHNTGIYGVELLWAVPGNCSSDNLCSVNATCVVAEHQPGHYNCWCNSEFKGNGFSNETGCSVVHPCDNAKCPKHSSCIAMNSTTYRCECHTGYDMEEDVCQPQRKKKIIETIGPILFSISSFVFAVILCAFFIHRKKGTKFWGKTHSLRDTQSFSRLRDVFKQNAKFYSLSEMQKATQNFKEELKLGQGSFGTVYKGQLEDGTLVAIKRANNVAGNRIEQFLNEVTILSQVNHRSLVKLLGCCIDTDVPLLVFEYVANGNLFEHLHTPTKATLLTWNTRLRIARETAEALAYLHSSAAQPIFHRDVKSSNILLDEKYVVKVGDFGISKLVTLGVTHVSTGVHGTPGYIDPQYQQNYQLTDKSDVYSFGVVLLELITGQKPVDFSRSSNDKNLAALCRRYIRNGGLKEIVDKRFDDCTVGVKEVADLAMRCTEFNKQVRPSMKKVAEDLMRIARMTQ